MKNPNKPNLLVNGNEIKGWNNQVEKIFAEDSKQETEEQERVLINRPLNNARNFTTQVYVNTKHVPHVYSKKSTY